MTEGRKWYTLSGNLILLIGLITLSLSSCKSKKVLHLPSSDVALPKEQALSLFLTAPNYSFFSGKAKLRVTSEGGTDKGTLYIRAISDSVIWMAVKRLSIEGGRVLITPDSATIINRLEKSYSKVALSELETRYGVTANFKYIQDMLLGFNPSVAKEDISEYKEEEAVYTLSTMLHDIYHEFDLSKSTGLTTGGRFNERFQMDGQWEYSEYGVFASDINLPYKRRYHLQASNNLDLIIDLQFSDIELNNHKEIRFSVPSHYTRIDL